MATPVTPMPPTPRTNKERIDRLEFLVVCMLTRGNMDVIHSLPPEAREVYDELVNWSKQ